MIVNKGHGNIYVGQGCTNEALGAIYEDAGGPRCVLLISDAAVDISRMLVMDFRGMVQVHCEKEPTYDYLETVIKNIRFLNDRSKFDMIIGIGGGSALDLTKAIAVLINNKKRALDFRGFDRVQERKVKTLLIPTTLSGSEATNNASFLDTEEKRKLGINGRHMFPDYVILDEDWLVDEGTRAWTSTVLDALTHAFESSICKQFNSFTNSYSNTSLVLLMSYLKGGDVSRTELQIAAFKAARALCNSGSGIAGALSYALGSLYGVPHGIAGGIFIPYVMEYNGYPAEAEVDRYLKAKKISRNLVDYGVESLDDLTEYIKGLQGAFDQNPIPFDAEKDGKILLQKHWRPIDGGKTTKHDKEADSGSARPQRTRTNNQQGEPSGPEDSWEDLSGDGTE